MSPPQTEYSFTLPVGLVDDEGTHHREGTMRLATARDEIEPLRDARVRENGAYLSVLRLARVLTKVGDIRPVTPAQVEQLYATDFAHLQRLYEQINSAPAIESGPIGAPVETRSSQSSADAAPVPDSPRPRALAGMSDAALSWMLGADTIASEAPAQPSDIARALPIGLHRERERSVSREALMRSPAPPRRGRVMEGPSSYPDSSPTSGRESEHTGERLMRLSSRPPTAGTAHGPAGPTPAAHEPTPAPPAPRSGGAGGDMEDVYEEMIARLRRELLVERERMGVPFEA